MGEFPDPSLVVLIGPSGSGKSTWAAERFRANEIVSLSQLQGAVGKDEHDPVSAPVAFGLLDRIVDVRLGRGLTVVVDTPGLDDGRRARWRDAARTHSIPAIAVLFSTDVGTCLARNERRDTPQPAATIKRQAARSAELAATIGTEGFEVHEVPGPNRDQTSE